MELFDSDDSPPPARGGSLADRLGIAARGRAAAMGSAARGLGARVQTRIGALPRRSYARRDWIVAASVAALLAAGPIVTIGGGAVLSAQARRDADALEARLAPQRAAAERARIARAELQAALSGPALTELLEALARGLPADASLVSATRSRDGAIRVEISTPDPDSLRAALRRVSELGFLRDAGQRQGEAGMIVALAGTPR